jgi:aromatase
MTDPARRHTVHTHLSWAPADVLYGLVADVTRWPVLLGPTLHAEVLEQADDEERFVLWALVNGEAKTWTSRRTRSAGERRIRFTQERSQPPIGSMGGAWHFRPAPGGATELVLEHDFTAAGDDPAVLDQLTAAVDRNSRDELAALAGLAERLAEHHLAPDDVVFAFEDEVRVTAPPEDIYTFVHRSDLWPERLPHVARVALGTPRPGVQDMEMDTVTPEGGHHTTRSIRLCFPECFPDRQIVYKQLVPPALLLGHSGSWDFRPDPDGAGGTVVTARHMVAIDPGRIEEVLGAGRTLADARSWLRSALGANSRATLSHAGRPEWASRS